MTFDDGPSGDTQQVLRILKDRNARATFFFIGGRVDGNPGIVRQALADGNAVGNHGYNHIDLTTLDAAQVNTELSRTQRALADATGEPATLGRPVNGASNTTVYDAFRANGMESVMWAYTPREWEGKSAEQVRQGVLDNVRGGDIVLLHDTSAAVRTALPGIIDELRSRGYCFGKIEKSDNYDQRNLSSVKVVAW